MADESYCDKCGTNLEASGMRHAPTCPVVTGNPQPPSAAELLLRRMQNVTCHVSSDYTSEKLMHLLRLALPYVKAAARRDARRAEFVKAGVGILREAAAHPTAPATDAEPYPLGLMHAPAASEQHERAGDARERVLRLVNELDDKRRGRLPDSLSEALEDVRELLNSDALSAAAPPAELTKEQWGAYQDVIAQQTAPADDNLRSETEAWLAQWAQRKGRDKFGGFVADVLLRRWLATRPAERASNDLPESFAREAEGHAAMEAVVNGIAAPERAQPTAQSAKEKPGA